jgi:hypothetical protein
MIRMRPRDQEDEMHVRPGDVSDEPGLRLLEPGEQVEVMTETTTAKLIVTDRRLAIATSDRVALDVAYADVRRIQFDIERKRPATLVIVPEHPSDEPQVLGVPPERYDDVTRALAIVGRRLMESS